MSVKIGFGTLRYLEFDKGLEEVILKNIFIIPLSGTFKNLLSFYEHEPQNSIEELILKVSRIQVTDLNKFNKSGFFF